jgi:hypothetical protein
MPDDGFTKQQQDAYFHEGRCPYCRSEQIRVGCGWDDFERPLTSYRPAFCDECEEQWVEVWYRDAGQKFLLRSMEELEASEGKEDEDADLGEGNNDGESAEQESLRTDRKRQNSAQRCSTW